MGPLERRAWHDSCAASRVPARVRNVCGLHDSGVAVLERAHARVIIHDYAAPGDRGRGPRDTAITVARGRVAPRARVAHRAHLARDVHRCGA